MDDFDLLIPFPDDPVKNVPASRMFHFDIHFRGIIRLISEPVVSEKDLEEKSGIGFFFSCGLCPGPFRKQTAGCGIVFFDRGKTEDGLGMMLLGPDVEPPGIHIKGCNQRCYKTFVIPVFHFFRNDDKLFV